MEDKGCFSEVCLCRLISVLAVLSSGIRAAALNLVQEMGDIDAPLLGSKREGREFFLCLLYLNCLQLKIINMPKCHI